MDEVWEGELKMASWLALRGLANCVHHVIWISRELKLMSGLSFWLIELQCAVPSWLFGLQYLTSQ